MTRVFVGLGSNVGDREAWLRAGLWGLATAEGVRRLRWVPWRETEPVGGPAGQRAYLNTAAEAWTTLSPLAFLTACQAVETRNGRDRSREVRWGPRTLDIDVLLWGEETLSLPGLTVPHPRMGGRRFVLEPLAELRRTGPT